MQAMHERSLQKLNLRKLQLPGAVLQAKLRVSAAHVVTGWYTSLVT